MGERCVQLYGGNCLPVPTSPDLLSREGPGPLSAHNLQTTRSAWLYTRLKSYKLRRGGFNSVFVHKAAHLLQSQLIGWLLESSRRSEESPQLQLLVRANSSSEPDPACSLLSPHYVLNNVDRPNIQLLRKKIWSRPILLHGCAISFKSNSKLSWIRLDQEEGKSSKQPLESLHVGYVDGFETRLSRAFCHLLHRIQLPSEIPIKS